MLNQIQVNVRHLNVSKLSMKMWAISSSRYSFIRLDGRRMNKKKEKKRRRKNKFVRRTVEVTQRPLRYQFYANAKNERKKFNLTAIFSSHHRTPHRPISSVEIVWTICWCEAAAICRPVAHGHIAQHSPHMNHVYCVNMNIFFLDFSFVGEIHRNFLSIRVLRMEIDRAIKSIVFHLPFHTDEWIDLYIYIYIYIYETST